MAALDFRGVQRLGIYREPNGNEISTYIWYVNHGRTVVFFPGESSRSLFPQEDRWGHVKEIESEIGYWVDDDSEPDWDNRTMTKVLAHELTSARRSIAEYGEQHRRLDERNKANG